MPDVQDNLREMQMLGHATMERLPPPAALGPLIRRGIATAGLSRAQPGFAFARPDPWHDTLLLTTAGSGLVWCDGEYVPCPPGTAYFAPAGFAHAYRCPAGGDWDLTWVTTTPRSFPVLKFGSGPGLSPAEPQALTAFVTQYCREAELSPDSAALEPLAELMTLSLARLTDAPRRLDELWARVEGRLDAPWTLGALAAAAGLSGEQLRAVCVRERGESPVRHLTRRRMMRAATLLLATSDTVERISRQVGYASPFAFTVAFSRWSGVAPSAYRSRAAAEPTAALGPDGRSR